MIVSVAYPPKALWPNGRAHHFAKHRAAQKAKKDAWYLALDALAKLPDRTAFLQRLEQALIDCLPIPIHITVFPKATGPLPDQDNCIAAAKHPLDGISGALGIDDKFFAAPTVEFSDKRLSRFEIEVRA